MGRSVRGTSPLSLRYKCPLLTRPPPMHTPSRSHEAPKRGGAGRGNWGREGEEAKWVPRALHWSRMAISHVEFCAWAQRCCTSSH